MRVIENNYNESEKEIVCPHCDSKLTYNIDDIVPTNGKSFIYCGACHRAICVSEGEEQLTPYFKPPYYCSKCENDFTTPTYIGAYGILYAKCPYCGNEEYMGDGIELTADNIEYPKHFGTYDGTEINDAKINEWIKHCINQLDKDNDYVYYGSGDTCVIAYKSDEDYHSATVIVAKKYQECEVQIPEENF